MPLDIIQTNTALPFFLFVFIFSSHFHGVTSHCAHKHNQYLVEHLWIHDRDEGDAFLHPCRWRCVCVGDTLDNGILYIGLASSNGY